MIAVVAVVVCAAVSARPGAAPAPSEPFTRFTVPGRANAHVSLDSSHGWVAAVWAATPAGGAADIFAAVSRDGGTSFGTPVRVNTTPGEARVNGEQPPRVAIVPASTGGVPRLTVMWTAKGPSGTVLLTSESTDGGATFSRSLGVPGTDAAGNRGWHALAADARGRVHAVWLDHRRTVAAAGTGAASHRHGDHAATNVPHGDGVAMAQRSDLYFHTLGASAPPRALTPGVCYCCKTAIAFGPQQQVYLAWRHVFPGNLRDMALLASSDGGRTFAPLVRVSDDRWALEGCPDDGPAMRSDAAGRVHLVWPAVVEERGGPVKALFYASSTDGRSFTPRQRIPTEGHANHPQLALAADGSLRVVWDESGHGGRRIAWATGDATGDGGRRFTRRPLDVLTGVYPTVAPAGEGAVVAWTHGAPDASAIVVARVD